MKTGLDRLLEGALGSTLAGVRIALASNESARDGRGRPSADCCLEAGLKVERLLAPEHGFDLALPEGQRFGPGRHPRLGLPVAPFYGDGLVLTPEALDGAEVLLFDLPNVGLRCHTYLANLVEAVRYCASHATALVVLDRPNTLGGLAVEGPPAGEPFLSDVAPVPLPFRHGLVWSELVQWLLRTLPARLEPRCVPMQGWRREQWHDATGLSWAAPSPNLRTFDAAVAYPATVWLEATTLSEGRGTAQPFEWFGAPWLRPGPALRALEALELPGVAFAETEFVPARSKHVGAHCAGLALRVVDRALYRPLETGLTLLQTLRDPAVCGFEWMRGARTGICFVDRLAGTDRLRLALEEGRSARELAAEFAREARAFDAHRREFLLYE